MAPSAAAPKPSPREQFELAESLERSDPDRAISIYGELASQSGTWADNALFAEARLELDRGHRAKAKQLLSEYLERFPQGPNASDAKALLERNR